MTMASRHLQQSPYGQIPGLPVPGAPVGDEVLKDVSVRAFEHIWPLMETRLDEKLARERYVTFAMSGLAMAGYFALLWAVGVKLPWQRKGWGR